MSPQRSGPIVILGFRINYFDSLCSEILGIEDVIYEDLHSEQLEARKKLLKETILERKFDGDYDCCTSIVDRDVDKVFIFAFPDPTIDEMFIVGVEMDGYEISLLNFISTQVRLEKSKIPFIQELLQKQEFKIHLADKRDLLYNDE